MNPPSEEADHVVADVGPQDMLVEPRGTVGTENAASHHFINLNPNKADIHFKMPQKAEMFDYVDAEFTQYFEYLEFERIASF